ncbi:MAG: hypothetical protein ACK57G_18275 [Planctomycetota bacterium]
MDPDSLTGPASMTDSTLSVYNGNEPFFTFFSSAEVALATLRLSLEDRCLFQASDLAAQMGTLRREFQHDGKVPEALQDVLRITNQLQARVQNWEREVQNRERAKLEMTGTRLQRLRVEASQVRGKIQMTDRVLAKLQIALHQIQAEEAERRASEDDENESVVAQFHEAINAFLGHGLAVESELDHEESPGSGFRAQVWDQPFFLAVAQWHREESTNGLENQRLVVCLIPKFKDIAQRAARIASSVSLRAIGSGLQESIAFDTSHPFADGDSNQASSPHTQWTNFSRSPSVLQELDRLIAKRFDQDRSQLVVLHAEIPHELARDGKVVLIPAAGC